MYKTDEAAPVVTVRREEYTPPAYRIDRVELVFDLNPDKTRVLNRMTVRRNPEVSRQPLVLRGEDLSLSRVNVDGKGASFKATDTELILEDVPDSFELEVFTLCRPAANTTLSGLYVSQDTFFTQCEAEGFRRITYFLDRPDVMAEYTVTLRADKQAYPVLLSNGNLVDSGELEDGRHFATWHDPFRKPSYLFALVAGKLVCREQTVIARNGKKHLLQVFVRSGDLDKTEHAMQSLLACMAWDEARFNLSLDLERYMIVATGDFNMGAMENKGLNVFNTRYVLASPATATDTDFENVESVIAHEYFHNWTGNRITCRDWFQLSLKEGLTVFRDQEFSQDMAGSASGAALRRIADVNRLRTVQFSEDAGPMSHPVRPDQYQEINNFYTATVYEKGAEVVRMMQTLVGKDGFAKGMKLYFERHDGQAVTCDDFAQAVADANPESPLAQHLDVFKRWYSQAGTPELTVTESYDADAQTYTLTFAQRNADTPGQTDKLPQLLPVRMGLLDAQGAAVPLYADGVADGATEAVLVISQAQQRFVFTGVAEQPVPSLLRGFSAPVRLRMEQSDARLLHLLAHDSDPFNRWEAAQQLLLNAALAAVASEAVASDAVAPGADALPADVLSETVLKGLRGVLRHAQLDSGFKAKVLNLPGETYLAEQLDEVHPLRIHAVRRAMQKQLATALQADWQQAYHSSQTDTGYSPDAVSSGRRELANLALYMLCLHATQTGDEVWPGKAYQRFKDADNMTDRIGALAALTGAEHALAASALERFYAMYRHEELVLDKWFTLQATAPHSSRQTAAQHSGIHGVQRVRRLMQHDDFNIKNPNRARSLIFAFCMANPGQFHREDAAGYVLWAENVVALDAINPQLAARLSRAMDNWARLAQPFRRSARLAIERLAGRPGLSRDTREILQRLLAVETATTAAAPAEATAGDAVVAAAAGAVAVAESMDAESVDNDDFADTLPAGEEE